MAAKEYLLTINYLSIFGDSTGQARLKKKEKGWDYWTEHADKWKKITRGRKYLIGETLEQVIANIERGGEYSDRKVIKIEPIGGGK